MWTGVPEKWWMLRQRQPASHSSEAPYLRHITFTSRSQVWRWVPGVDTLTEMERGRPAGVVGNASYDNDTAGQRPRRYADLICIGSQKSGTTWLHRMLCGHPKIFAPVFKEIHYFDCLHVRRHRKFHERRCQMAQRRLDEQLERTAAHRAAVFLLARVIGHPGLRRYAEEVRYAAQLKDVTLDDDWYASQFKGAGPEQLAIDFTTAYSMLNRKGILHILRLNPDARVFYVVRNPVDRALSHARMLTVRHRHPKTTASLRHFLDGWAVKSRDNCVKVIDRWQRELPPDQFRVFFYDELKARPLDFLARVCDFAGLPFDARYFPRVANPVYRGPSIPTDPEIDALLHARYQPLVDEMKRRYPAETAAWGEPASHHPPGRAADAEATPLSSPQA